jgi:predicted nucleic acid-binding Zn ribbon protein
MTPPPEREPPKGPRRRGVSKVEGKHRPEQVGDVLKSYLKESGLEGRVEQAAVIPEWEALVGRKIAEIAEPLFITMDATLFIAVESNPWMTELQLMEPELLRAINAVAGRLPVRRLRFQLRR